MKTKYKRQKMKPNRVINRGSGAFGRSLLKLKNIKSRVLHKKDFACSVRYRNPYKLKEGLNTKKKLEILLLIITTLGFIYTLIYHNFFHIKEINVNGLDRIEKEEFVDSVYGILECKKFFIFPGQAYIFTDVNEIRNIIIEKYPIETIVVTKQFPHNINIEIEEKISTVIYDNGEKYSYLGLDGNVIEILGNVDEREWEKEFKITTTTLADGTIKEEKELINRTHRPAIDRVIGEFGSYPILFDSREKKIDINEFVIKPEIVYGAIEWYNHINKKTDLSFGFITIDNELGEGTIKIREGWEMFVNLKERFGQQFDQLEMLLAEINDRSTLNYIDLRYPDRLYWK
jgi:cell division septal protein FtsQ